MPLVLICSVLYCSGTWETDCRWANNNPGCYRAILSECFGWEGCGDVPPCSCYWTFVHIEWEITCLGEYTGYTLNSAIRPCVFEQAQSSWCIRSNYVLFSPLNQALQWCFGCKIPQCFWLIKTWTCLICRLRVTNRHSPSQMASLEHLWRVERYDNAVGKKRSNAVWSTTQPFLAVFVMT